MDWVHSHIAGINRQEPLCVCAALIGDCLLLVCLNNQVFNCSLAFSALCLELFEKQNNQDHFLP